MHDRKKGGQRKDKKMERMHEDVDRRHQAAHPPKPTHDQVDHMHYKPGGPSDHNREQGPQP
jgi:hypothetical protein